MPNVTTEVRIRPSPTAVLDCTNTSVTIGSKTFAFSRVHTTTTQRALFADSVSPFVDHFVSGYDCAVLAYGQTGSGKTYTMGMAHGARGAVVQQALERLYGMDVRVRVSFMEIYNDEVIDLLGETRSPLSIRQRGESVAVVGLREHAPGTVAEAVALLDSGCLERTTRRTKMNAASSRSHAIFTVVLRQEREGAVVESQMAFVDLAGSERLKRTECEGCRARESIAINSGLLALGNVINALYLGRTHTPYRDSKLTRILARCLGSQMLLIACVSPEPIDAFETANTLKYAGRAALISRTERMHVVSDGDKLVIDQLRREVSRLKDENMRLRVAMNKRAHDSLESVRAHPYVADLLKTINRLRVRAGNEQCNEQSNEQCGTKTVMTTHLSDPFRSAPLRCTNRSIEVRQRNTQFNKKITVEEEEKAEVQHRERLVSFDLKPRPVRGESVDMNDISHSEPSKGAKALFTPRKERFKVWPVAVGTAPYRATALVPFQHGVVASCTDGHVRLFGERETVLLSDNAVRCLATDQSDSPATASRIFYSSRSLLKVAALNDRPAPLHAYRSEVSALRVVDNLVYTGHEDGSLCLFDIRSNKPLFAAQIHRSTVFDIAVTPDHIYTCSRDHSVRHSDPNLFASGSCRASPDNALAPPHYDTVSLLLAYGPVLVSAGRDCSIKTWHGTRPFKTVPYAHDGWIRAGAVLGNCWATGCKNGSVQLWDLIEDSVRCVGKISTGSPIASMAAAGNQLWVGCQKEIQMYKVPSNPS